jgi:ribosomal protein S18 acetylase RimI-like enzyme
MSASHLAGAVPSIRFEPIDLARHGETCVRFRRDSYYCSFGAGEAFDAARGGAAGYIERLRERLVRLPEGIVHVWRGDTIIGQIEAQIAAGGIAGYVNLFYLVPEERGSGAGDALHDYVVSLFSRLDVPSIRLSVSPGNARALKYYAKHGWRDVGPRPDHPTARLLERVVVRRD